MSGFKDDVISILRHNSILQRESVGLIFKDGPGTEELFYTLRELKFLVVGHKTKPVLQYDYVVIEGREGPTDYSLEKLLYAFSVLSTGGIIVFNVVDKLWDDKYVSLFGGFTATKVRYEDRVYMVIHAGVDYAD